MTIATSNLSLRHAALPPTSCTGPRLQASKKKPLDRNERRGILALIALFVPTTLFWATYEQQGNTIVLWADDHTDRTINLIF